jgi:hypothetical protein
MLGTLDGLIYRLLQDAPGIDTLAKYGHRKQAQYSARGANKTSQIFQDG